MQINNDKNTKDPAAWNQTCQINSPDHPHLNSFKPADHKVEIHTHTHTH